MTYTKDIADKAARHFLRRFVGKEAAVDVVFIAIAGALWASGMIESWLALVMIGAGMAFILLILIVSWRYVKLAQSKLKAMTNPIVLWRFDQERISTESDLGAMQVPWSTITKVWRYDGVWLLFFSGGHGYSTLPTQEITPEIRTFIEQQIHRAGGKVI